MSQGPEQEPLERAVKINLLRLKHRYWALGNFQWYWVAYQEIADLPKASCRQLEKVN